jgi:hypothetical protein
MKTNKKSDQLLGLGSITEAQYDRGYRLVDLLLDGKASQLSDTDVKHMMYQGMRDIGLLLALRTIYGADVDGCTVTITLPQKEASSVVNVVRILRAVDDESSKRGIIYDGDFAPVAGEGMVN